ncbi:MAG: DMT family transporter [Caldilineaceae bacterium]
MTSTWCSVQWFLRPYNTWMITTLIVVGAGAVLALMWLARGADTYVPGWFGWTAILFQSVVATYLGRMMTYNAVKIIGSGQFTLLAPLETMLTIVWSVLFLDERLAPLQWLGAVLILVGALLAADAVWQQVTRRWHSELRTSS